MKRPWFTRKRYGWGWTPATWQGWLVIAVYALALAYLFTHTDLTSHSASDTLVGMVLPALVLSLALILICYLTGERPRWQWGDDDTRS